MHVRLFVDLQQQQQIITLRSFAKPKQFHLIYSTLILFDSVKFESIIFDSTNIDIILSSAFSF